MQKPSDSVFNKAEQPLEKYSSIRENHSLLIKAIESIKDYAIFMLDSEGRVITWNKGAEHIQGYKVEEIIGQSFTNFYKKEAVAKHYPEYELQIAKEKGRFEEEGWRVRKDGSTFWANIIITAIYNDQDQLLGFAIVTRDLTEHHFYEKKMTTLQKGVDSITDYAIFMLDPEGKVATWNKGAEYIQGYKAEEIIGQSFTKFYKLDAKEKHYPESILKIAKEKGHVEDEDWCVRKDGSTFWANVIITAIYNEKNELTGFMKVTRDLTERHFHEKKMETLQRGVNSITDYAIFMLDTEGRIISWNPGFERIKGYKAEEIIGQYLEKLYRPEDREKGRLQYVLQMAKEKGHYEDEDWRIRKNGSLFWAHVTLTAIYNQKDELTGFLEVTRDLTERKLAEAKLKESEHHYRTLASIAPVGIFHSAVDGHLIYVNVRACELMGISEKEAHEEGWFHAIHPEDYERVVNDWKQALKNKSLFKSAFRFKRPDGQITWVLSQATPEFDTHHQVKSYVQTITDINEHKTFEEKEKLHLETIKKAEAEQRSRAVEAEEQKQKMAVYIDTICHGIRNPLTGIYGNNEFLKKDITSMKEVVNKIISSDPLELKEILTNYLLNAESYTQSTDECVAHQKVVIDDVLSLSRLESKKLELNIMPFSPKKVVISVSEMFKAQVVSKGLKLSIHLPQEEILIKSDLNIFSQILTNLVGNAIKFTSQGTITVSLQTENVKKNASIQVVVEDTGIGMDEEELNRIFKPFSQANKNVTHLYGGSGLGLFISKRMVELLGGTLTVKSQPKKGAQFTFNLHCELVSEEEKAQFNKQEELAFDVISQAPISSKPILLVEDNAINRKVLQRMFEDGKYKYQLAVDGKEAVEKYQSGDFTCIFMDIEMPNMDGLEATKRIRQLEQNLKRKPVAIIGLSGNARPEQIEEAKKVGMNDYLTKPYTKKQIFDAIKKWRTVVAEFQTAVTAETITTTSQTLFTHIHKKKLEADPETNLELEAKKPKSSSS